MINVLSTGMDVGHHYMLQTCPMCCSFDSFCGGCEAEAAVLLESLSLEARGRLTTWMGTSPSRPI